MLLKGFLLEGNQSKKANQSTVTLTEEKGFTKEKINTLNAPYRIFLWFSLNFPWGPYGVLKENPLFASPTDCRNTRMCFCVNAL